MEIENEIELEKSTINPIYAKLKVQMKKSRRGVKARSITKRCGLQFPVTRIKKSIIIPNTTADRIATLSPIAIATAAEYIMAEILEMSSDQAIKSKRKRIQPKDIMNGIRNDEEMCKVFPKACFVGAGTASLPSSFQSFFFPKNSAFRKHEDKKIIIENEIENDQ